MLFRRCSLAAIAALACGSLALGAAQAPASGVLSSYALTPDSTQAGGNPGVTADLAFAYANRTDSVRSFTLDLPTGLLASIANVPATCSPDQLTVNACPPGSQIGSGTVTTRDGGGDVPRDTGLYLMAPPAPGDAAGFGTVVIVGRTPYTGVGVLDVVSGSGGQPIGRVTLSVPVERPEQVVELRATMHATTADGKAFTRLPTSCSTATSSVTADTAEGDSGAGTDSFVPTGCGVLGYAPALSAVHATKDPHDDGVELIATLSQPGAQAESATKALELRWPSSLVPDAATVGACLTGAPCRIGTATATSWLAPLSYLQDGTITLGGTPSGPTLTIAFPAPLPASIVGAIDLAKRTVTFPAVPDLPLRALTVDITGPAGANALTTTCAPGVVGATFTPQSGGATVTSTQPVVYRGCPSPPGHAALSISIDGRRAPFRHRRTTLRVACGGGAARSVCHGKLSLTVRKRVVRRVHGRRTTSHRTIVLARAEYRIASGRTRPVPLELTDAGLRLLSRDRGDRLRVRATATLHGGATVRRTLVAWLSPAVPGRLPPGRG